MALGAAKVVVAIDFGTTYSGIWICIYNSQKSPPWIHLADPTFKRECQTKTEILLDENFHCLSFGDSAEKKRIQEKKAKLHLFRTFKMCLWDEKTKDIRDPCRVEDQDGISYPAEKVFVPALKFLATRAKEVVLKGALEKFKDEDYLWIITVPAMWSLRARLKMKEWAKAAGLTQHSGRLELALEPEAASLACIERFGPKPKIPFLVLDCGGGTIDVVGHYLDQEKKGIREIVAPFGAAGGSTQIDKCMEQDLKSALSEIYDDIPIKIRTELLDQFIKAKEGWDGEQTMYIEIQSYASLNDLAKRRGTSLTSLFETADFDYNEETHELAVSAERLTKYFGTCVTILTKLLTENFSKINDTLVTSMKKGELDSNLKYFLCVGGLFESSFYLAELEKFLATSPFYKDLKIECKKPSRAVLAVLEGAGIYGCSKIVKGEEKAILSRISPLTYGVATTSTWIKGVHLLEKKVDDRCVDLFTAMIGEGQRVEAGAVIEKSFVPVNKMYAAIQIYQATAPATFVTSQGVSKLGELVVNLKPSSLLSPQVTVRFSFGTTSLDISAFQAETKEELEASLYIPLSRNVVPEVLFLIDRSSSMAGHDIAPQSTTWAKNRLGTVFECVSTYIRENFGDHKYSMITFNTGAEENFEFQQKVDLDAIILKMKEIQPEGGTNFSVALKAAQTMFERRKNQEIITRIFFLSDGEAALPVAELKELKSKYPGVSIWAVHFGASHGKVLQELATLTKGTFTKITSGEQLASNLAQFAIQEVYKS